MSTSMSCCMSSKRSHFKRLHRLQVIREELLPCLEVATSGLLAVVLRGLACGCAAYRSRSYAALALYSAALEQSNFRHVACLGLPSCHGAWPLLAH